MTFSGPFQQLLFWFPVAALAILSLVFILRRTFFELPFFFLYTSSSFVFGVFRYSAFKIDRNVFFYVFWISELAGAVIFSLALYEVFLRRLFPRFHKVSLYRALFPIVAAAILMLTIIAVLQSSDRGAAFHVASQAFDFVRTAFLVFFMLLMLLMGRQWSRYDLGITLGFGLQAAAALLNAAVKARLGHRSQFFDTAEAITFDIACVIWLVTFSKPEQSDRLQPAEALDPLVLPQARKWESVLKDWLTPGKRII